jgi:transcriptional regulator with XRE-family HTH domain
MTTKSGCLRGLREAAGLTLRELARQLGEHPSNVSYWERTGKAPRADLLLPMAKVLGVTVEELLGEPKLRKTTGPGGKARQVFESVARLPRRQQQKILEVVEALVEKAASA